MPRPRSESDSAIFALSPHGSRAPAGALSGPDNRQGTDAPKESEEKAPLDQAREARAGPLTWKAENRLAALPPHPHARSFRRLKEKHHESPDLVAAYAWHERNYRR
jgi:hypothetical protein